MMRRAGGVLGTIGAIALFTSAIFAVTSRTDAGIRRPPAAAPITIMHPDAQTMAAAEADKATYTKYAQGQVVAGILPHHLLVSPLIAGWFAGVQKQTAPQRVVVIGPDHQNAGRGTITTTERDWRMINGSVSTDARVVNALTVGGLSTMDDALWAEEYSVGAIIPFIHQVWPQARLVSLAVKSTLTLPQANELAAELHRLLGPNDIVLASVDFSHYQNTLGAWTDDVTTLPAISSGDPARIMTAPVDSPPALAVVMAYARHRQAEEQQIVHTNSAEFTGNLSAPSTTSYLTAYFTRP